MCVFVMCVRSPATVCLWRSEDNRQLAGDGFLWNFACEFRGLHSGGQAWHQVPLFTEPFLWPTLHIFNAIIINGIVL